MFSDKNLLIQNYKLENPKHSQKYLSKNTFKCFAKKIDST